MKPRYWWVVEISATRAVVHRSRSLARDAVKFWRDHGFKPRIVRVVEVKA